MARSTLLVECSNLAVAVLQLLFFVPILAGGGSLDILVGGPFLFRVDGLSLSFGVLWTVALACLLLAGIGSGVQGALMAVGLLLIAYAREPLMLLAGWEITGLS